MTQCLMVNCRADCRRQKWLHEDLVPKQSTVCAHSVLSKANRLCLWSSGSVLTILYALCTSALKASRSTSGNLRRSLLTAASKCGTAACVIFPFSLMASFRGIVACTHGPMHSVQCGVPSLEQSSMRLHFFPPGFGKSETGATWKVSHPACDARCWASSAECAGPSAMMRPSANSFWILSSSSLYPPDSAKDGGFVCHWDTLSSSNIAPSGHPCLRYVTMAMSW